MGNDHWKPFWFEGNRACGWIESPGDWERIKNEYGQDTKFLASAKSWDANKRPYFGFYLECNDGVDTLGEFANRNGMEL